MKAKILKKLIIIICILAITLPISSEVLARITSTVQGTEQKFGITHLHSSKYLNGSSSKNFGYKVGDRKVYRIYAGENNSDGYVNTVLCLDEYGKFPAEDSTTDKYKSLGEATSQVLQTLKTTKNGVKTTLTADDSNKIIWLMKNAVLPEDSQELQDAKLSKIFAATIQSTQTTQNPLTLDYVKSILTEDDLVFALQATLWSITNPENNPVYQGTTDGSRYNSLTGNDVMTSQGLQGSYINIIINYYKQNYDGRNGNIVKSTSDGAVVPKLTTPTQKITFTNGTAPAGTTQGTIDNGYMFVGPFKIEPSQTGKTTVDYSVNITFQDATGKTYSPENVNYFVKAGKTISSQNLAQTKEGLEGKEFYIALRQGTTIRKINIKLNSASIISDSTPTAWSVSANDMMQPLISAQRTESRTDPVEGSYEFDATFSREFDIALRKSIVAVYRNEGGVWKVVQNYPDPTRIPVDAVSNTKEFNQYEYSHPKNPVEVKIGDIVKYKLRVINEGKFDVKITQIIDYLPPSGLEFLKDGWEDENHTTDYSSNQAKITQTGNKIIIDKPTNSNDIKGTLLGTNKSQGKLQYIDVELEFRVTEGAKGKVVTNIAEVTGFTGQNDTDGDGNGDGTFIPQKDCDSSVNNVVLPTTEDEWQNYKGNGTNKDDLTDSTYYYKGQEDDDDFEKIKVEGSEGSYHFQLTKTSKTDPSEKLQGAEFKVTMPDGSTYIGATNTEGILKTGDIKIEQVIQNDIITIEEIKAPVGFSNLPGKITVDVSKKEVIENGKSVYKINTVIVQDENESSGATAAENNNTLDVNVPNKKIEGSYNLNLLKIDKNDTSKKLSNAEFKITMPDGTVQTKTTDTNGNINITGIQITQEGTDIITIEETKAPSGYNKIIGNLTLQITKEKVSTGGTSQYSITNINMQDSSNQTLATAKLNGQTIEVTVPNEKAEGNYNLALLKIDKNDTSKKLANAEFKITMPDGTVQTKTTDANGNININGVQITQAGTDTITIEETKAPSGYNKIIGKLTLQVTKEEKTENNQKIYGISNVSIQDDTNQNISTAKLNGQTIEVTVPNEKISGGYNINLLKVDQTDTTKKLANAEFKITMPDGTVQTKTTDTKGNINIGDIKIDSIGTDTITIEETKAPSGYNKIIGKLTLTVNKGDQTENNQKVYIINNISLKDETNQELATARLNGNTVEITVPNKKNIYDLALKKYVSSVSDATNNAKEIEKQEKRELQVTSIEKLKEREQGQIEKADASYDFGLDKSQIPVSVEKGDYVTYTIRVYNEGNIEAKVGEIIDSIPEELTFLPDSSTNKKYGWEKFKDETSTGWKEGIKTTILKDVTLPAFDSSKENETSFDSNTGIGIDKGISYAEVKIECKVNDKAKDGEPIKNIAEITEDDGDDNDSEPDDKNPEEDDEDFDIVIPTRFDLALRKFITKIENKEITDRVPKVDTTELDNKTSTTAKYQHPKQEDIKVVVKDQIVIYTIRIYNEGTKDGYASEIKDDLPEGITFLPEHEINKENLWKMYDKDGKETDDITKAVEIRTRKFDPEGRSYTQSIPSDYTPEKYPYFRQDPYLLAAYDPDLMKDGPAYVDVQVAFKVTKENVTDGESVIINTAEITENKDKNGKLIDDDDSTPDNDKPEEDDIDKEYLQLKYFDLSLLKYVSKVIVTEDGVTKETETGYDGTENPEPVVKVELNKQKVSKTQISYLYTIKITNEGQIEGYAKEITDRIPDGLAFYEEDNKEWNWKIKEDGIVTTDYLKDKLLKPGESATVPIMLRWENSETNLGQKINVAEISKDENEYGVPDIDSTPNNNVDGEDDQDNAIVVLSISTGRQPVYIVLITIISTILLSGGYLIYKYVIKN